MCTPHKAQNDVTPSRVKGDLPMLGGNRLFVITRVIGEASQNCIQELRLLVRKRPWAHILYILDFSTLGLSCTETEGENASQLAWLMAWRG